jgi:hypothetical protein
MLSNRKLIDSKIFLTLQKYKIINPEDQREFVVIMIKQKKLKDIVKKFH